MAFVQTAQTSRIEFFATLRVAFDELKADLALRQKFRATVRELSSMNDRELADIGINRYDIKGIAKAHVYG